ncbi:phosphatidylserine lipase ABHD16A [Eudromia elegans]
MAKLLSCVLGPRLYRVYPEPGPAPGARGARRDPPWESFYQPRSLERHADSVLALASVLWSLSCYSSPLAFVYLYRKGLLTLPRAVQLSHCAATALLLLAAVACVRGIGRWTNPQYLEFISVLEETHRGGGAESRRKLARYNFDFRSWPVDFRWDEAPSRWDSRGAPLLRPPLRKLPCRLASWLLARTLGRRLLYPGSVGLLQRALLPLLLRGQARLVEECGGQRVKLLARDGNEIDAMFVDRRGGAEPQGHTLVICCEGNAGFYEVGCLATPLDAGYSVLGWNHPGFAGSTGVPLPQSEANAVDVVLQFALQRLRFPPRRVALYAWSIGGFAASWAAMSYPELGGLVLDASFDDLLPLALKVLPRAWRDLVTLTVREHLNLNNGEQLGRRGPVPGAVLLVRRTRDEIITTTVPEDVASNRGNDLLLQLLQHRVPRVLADEGTRVVREWLEVTTPEEESDELSVEERRRLALFLARKHLQNFEASHCTPLPPPAFRLPWRLRPPPQ